MRASLNLLAVASILPLTWGMAVIVQPRQEFMPEPDPDNNAPSGPPPPPVDARAPELDKRFQPALDFDKDSCYNAPAIGPGGELSLGLSYTNWPPQTECRNEDMLPKANVYSRQRCNKDYCAILYGYYFQKDTATPVDGHRHDWEHVIVWYNRPQDRVSHVSVSQHKEYETKRNEDIQWTAASDGHPAVVYHKDDVKTHCFRFADGADFGNGGPEVHGRQWQMGPLIGYHGWPNAELRDKMLTHDWKGAIPAIRNEKFKENLDNAIRSLEKLGDSLNFDTGVDDDGTNNV